MSGWIKLRRTQLATPGGDPNMIAKAPRSGADEVFLDLEDSVAPDEKVEARQNVVEGLVDRDWDDTLRCYRINGVDSRWWYEDIIDVVAEAGGNVDSIMVPMVTTRSDIVAVDKLLTQVEVNNDLKVGEIGLQAQIESAKGMSLVRDIAAGSNRLETLVFGPGDYAASVGAAGLTVRSGEAYPGHYWHYQLARIVHAAKEYGLQAIDGPYAEVDDIQGFREASHHAAMLGCDGKWAIHPRQIEPANEIFAPQEEEAVRAQRIVEEYQQASEKGQETVSIEGELVDEATYEMARNIAEKARQAGIL